MSPNPDSSTTTHTTQIDTGGGASITSNVDLANGDFIGRDQIIQGDFVQGNKIIHPAPSELSTRTTRFLWWLITILAILSLGLWLYLWWRWQYGYLAVLQSRQTLLAAIASFVTALLVWLHTKKASPAGTSILAEMVDPVLDSFIHYWRGIFYRKHYLDNLLMRIRYHDTGDLHNQSSVSIEQFYVEPYLRPRSPHKIPSSVVMPDERRLDESCHPIWYYLRIAQPYKAVGDQPVVILAGPGYGKSTLLRHIVLSLNSCQNENRIFSNRIIHAKIRFSF